MTEQNNNYNKINELNELYQEVIIDHFKHPRFKGSMPNCRFCQQGKNPVCGDMVSIYCRVSRSSCPKRESLLSLSFEGSGCSISQASASIMCELIQNKNIDDAKETIENAEKIYMGHAKKSDENEISSDIEALRGVSLFPTRVKCAALAWKTLESLIFENFDSSGCPLERSCEKHIASLKLSKKLRIVTTETQ